MITRTEYWKSVELHYGTAGDGPYEYRSSDYPKIFGIYLKGKPPPGIILQLGHWGLNVNGQDKNYYILSRSEGKYLIELWFDTFPGRLAP